jgi:hypothetical protein
VASDARRGRMADKLATILALKGDPRDDAITAVFPKSDRPCE